MYWIRSLLPIDMKSASKSVARNAAAGTSTIMPSGGTAASTPASGQPVDRLLEQLAEGLELRRYADHRRHDLEVPADGGARQGAQLDGEDLRPGERQPEPPQPEERVALALGRQTGDRLVAARVQGPDDHRAARRPPQDLHVGEVLAGLVGQVRAAEQELGPGQTDAVRVPGIDRRQGAPDRRH